LVEAVDPAVDRERLAAFPCVFHDRGAGEVFCLGDDVELAETVGCELMVK